MVRRGWRAVETPQGWFNVIRGPRPHPRDGRWRRETVSRPRSIRWGVDVGVRVAVHLELSLLSPNGCGHLPKPPSLLHRQRVAQLEGALATFGDATGPEVTMLQNSLKVAKKAAQEPPLEVQLSLCESFVSRAQKRLVAHDQARELLAKELDEGERRVARLRVAVTEKVPPPPAKDAESEIAALRARLASVEEERDAAMGRPAKRVATGPSFGARRPETVQGVYWRTSCQCATKKSSNGCKIDKQICTMQR